MALRGFGVDPLLTCVQTSPISIGDVCTQANPLQDRSNKWFRGLGILEENLKDLQKSVFGWILVVRRYS